MHHADPASPSAASPRVVRKRDGVTLQSFDRNKVYRAVLAAWMETGQTEDSSKINQVVDAVENALRGTETSVEKIQDVVEMALDLTGNFQVAKAYIIYRHQRAETRRARGILDSSAIADYIHGSKYARHLPEEARRETYEETVFRVEAMHQRRFSHVPGLEEDIRKAFDLVRQKRVLPSMRSMQFGGAAIEANHNRIYNCSFTLIDRIEAFSQGMYLLLCGCGVGYSVQFEHVEQLPPLRFVDVKDVRHHVVADTIEGWADALAALIDSYVQGYYLELAYHLVRPAGTPLRTSGGLAPGHVRLKAALEAIRQVLHGAQGRKLRPIECHRVMCQAAGAVLSGGIRRSAMIALFSLDDGEMLHAKTGDWWEEHREPYFAYANNSVAIKRGEVKERQFKRVFNMTREFGDPGFVFLEDASYGVNPCAEIGLNPRLVVDDEVIAMAASRGTNVATLKGQAITGWAFCNLCEINAARLTCLEDLLEAARAAALIGTLQASYTSFPYLGWVSEMIARREALLGVGMTGMMDVPDIACDPGCQRAAAQVVVQENARCAALIGIRPAARVTCVKPSGTTSLELGCVGSGHHAHHDRRYIRRVTADEYEVTFIAFRERNPHMCVRKPDGKWVIEFPVQAPDGAILKKDLRAIPFLEKVRSTQANWVVPGTVDSTISPGLTHNVSNTINVGPDEWEDVADYIWRHQADFTGIALLPEDHPLPFMPFESVQTEAQERRWNDLAARYQPVDYGSIREVKDGTRLADEPACAGGACAL